MSDLNSRTRKYSDSVCKEGNNLITNDQSEFSLCPTQRNSFANEFNSHGKRLFKICKSADLRSPRIQTLIGDYIAGDTFNENTELSLEKVENILITTAKCCLKIREGKTRMQCPKSMDDTRKGEDVPSISD